MMTENNSEDIVNIIDSIKLNTVDLFGKLDDENDIFKYLKIIIENIEKENLKGKEKKEMSIKILRGLVDESELEESKKVYCLSIIDNGVIGNSIDMIILAASGELEVNMDIKTAETICSNFIIPCGKASYKAYKK